MKRKIALFCAIAAIAASGQAQGESLTIKPGLWEQTVTMKSQSGQLEEAMAQMQKQMASMPEGQRKMMEQMMASQGVSLGAQEHSLRVCVSKEEAAMDRLPMADKGCTQENPQRAGNTIKVKFACTGPPPSSGEGELTILSPTEYRGRGVVDTLVAGQPEQLRIEQAGRWLAADCGNVVPARK